MARLDVSWKRVAVAAAATLATLYAFMFALQLASDGAGSGVLESGSPGWLVVFVFFANLVWWGILLYPRHAKQPAPSSALEDR